MKEFINTLLAYLESVNPAIPVYYLEGLNDPEYVVIDFLGGPPDWDEMTGTLTVNIYTTVENLLTRADEYNKALHMKSFTGTNVGITTHVIGSGVVDEPDIPYKRWTLTLDISWYDNTL